MRVLAVAHRAANSLEGLHAANELGVDVIECDVHEHRGRLEVRHLKTAGPLPFLWDRWEVAPASTPRLGLDELLEAGRHGTELMLDLKGRRASTARAIASTLHETAPDLPITVCGRWWPSVEAVARPPYVRAVLSARNRAELAKLRRRVAQQPPVHGVSVHRSLLDARTVDELHRHVDVVMTWPVNDEQALDEVLAIGVSGVISDDLEVLSALMSRRG